MEREELKQLIRNAVLELHREEDTIPIGISNRHIHLSKKDYNTLFPYEPLRKRKDLKQPGEFAAEQTVTIRGPKGKIERVRLLAPLRKETQVEISKTDARHLGIDAKVSMSGDLSKAEYITIETSHGSITEKCCIIAKRHIHMNFEDAERLGVSKGERVKVEIRTPERTTIYDDVIIRPHENFILEMHIDTDEANAADAGIDTVGRIIK